jgi:hypothetical protein
MWLSGYSDSGLVAMMKEYSAHFDASGNKEKHRVVTVAGCVSTVEKWTRFQGEWNAILEGAGLPKGTIFHMTDFASCQRAFAMFDGKPTLKHRLTERLAACLKKNVNKLFSVGIAVSHYERLNTLFMLEEELGSVSAFAGLMCIQKVLKWKSKQAPSSKVEFFFEDGDAFFPEMKRNSQRLHTVTPMERTKLEMVQFQACDLIAWKNRMAITEAKEASGEKDLQRFESINRSTALIEAIPNDFGVFDAGELRKMCNSGAIPRRKSVA